MKAKIILTHAKDAFETIKKANEAIEKNNFLQISSFINDLHHSVTAIRDYFPRSSKLLFMGSLESASSEIEQSLTEKLIKTLEMSVDTTYDTQPLSPPSPVSFERSFSVSITPLSPAAMELCVSEEALNSLFSSLIERILWITRSILSATLPLSLTITHQTISHSSPFFLLFKKTEEKKSEKDIANKGNNKSKGKSKTQKPSSDNIIDQTVFTITQRSKQNSSTSQSTQENIVSFLSDNITQVLIPFLTQSLSALFRLCLSSNDTSDINSSSSSSSSAESVFLSRLLPFYERLLVGLGRLFVEQTKSILDIVLHSSDDYYLLVNVCFYFYFLVLVIILLLL